MKIISLILLLAAALLSVAEASATCRNSSGNPPDFAQAVLYLTGASDLESVPENEAERVSELLKYEMEHAAELAVPLTVDVEIGHSWAEAH